MWWKQQAWSQLHDDMPPTHSAVLHNALLLIQQRDTPNLDMIGVVSYTTFAKTCLFASRWKNELINDILNLFKLNVT